MRLRTVGQRIAVTTAVAAVATLTLTGAASAGEDDPLPPGAVAYICDDGEARRVEGDELERMRETVPAPPGRPGRVELHDGARPAAPGTDERFGSLAPGRPELRTFGAPGADARRLVIIGSGPGGAAVDPEQVCAAPDRLPDAPRWRG